MSFHLQRLLRILICSVVLALAFDAGSAMAASDYSPAPAINAAFLAKLAAPSGSVPLCIVDTGADITRVTAPALAGEQDVTGLGTSDGSAIKHGSTIIASLAGSGPDASLWSGLRIMSVRAYGTDGYTDADVAAGINQCVSDGAKVVLLALAGPGASAELQQSVAAAESADVLLVAAAGDQPGTEQDPAALPGVLSVGASNEHGQPCAGMAQGTGIDLLAPGCDSPLGEDENGNTVAFTGSSYSAALVAGVAAALRDYAPSLSAAQIMTDLEAGGAGAMLNAGAAFRAAGVSPGIMAQARRTKAPAVSRRLAAPHVHAVFGHGTLIVSATKLTRGERLVVTARGGTMSGGRVLRLHVAYTRHITVWLRAGLRVSGRVSVAVNR